MVSNRSDSATMVTLGSGRGFVGARPHDGALGAARCCEGAFRMCGIAGVICFNSGCGGQLHESLVRTMCELTEHRGPDDSGVMSRSRYALGSQRLSIIDLSPAGHMPMSDASGRWWITYNGEVYNFETVREELLRLGHSFRSRTDTEVILHAYMEWGEGCMDRFVGMFAFAILDAERGDVALVRDRYGVKPLYYARSGSHLLFASEIKALMGLLERPQVDRHSLLEWSLYRNVDALTPETLVEDVHSVLPGRALATARSVLHGLGSRWPSGLSGLVPGCADRSCRRALSGPRKQPWRRGRRGGPGDRRGDRNGTRGLGDVAAVSDAPGEARRSVRGLGVAPRAAQRAHSGGSEAAGDLETERCVRGPMSTSDAASIAPESVLSPAPPRARQVRSGAIPDAGPGAAQGHDCEHRIDHVPLDLSRPLGAGKPMTERPAGGKTGAARCADLVSVGRLRTELTGGRDAVDWFRRIRVNSRDEPRGADPSDPCFLRPPATWWRFRGARSAAARAPRR